ncbi:MAG: protein-L-isoaspartate(D-aspartate) O-methyltransferase [Gammaproteobacteria bacterium]|nr:MAG: protein-L-isoaspartate(D-aspartate) O-methyltransferase [Gammaproteobacteria bacterium]TLZ01593.1 MAG: protein-L-isoaspartate(D-aspartate) O-methyltransferase [Gammaproteobacteria bacterium]TLZ20569.1 MAG: protein-L-isoaspartate(D-aspartate) O-methyltransferase [Gammaproteobacteria bacterium]TLZ42680.1 MAG: protein-L-isoaspartate(D-aspartate) O-methyltransferase [Gammaproteobacteria bacterium]
MTDLRLSGIGMTSARTRDRLVQRLREQGIANLAVLDRIRNVPRHIFVDEALGSRAYEDTALPIGYGQTISQPYIVARMTEALLAAGAADSVLEVGTGCGYQTAVLAPLVARLYTIERIEPLLARARERLRELGVRNVRFRHGDGTLGWRAHAPFDGILVAAAPLTVPEALVKQLRVGGRLVVPVGPEGEQELVRFTRREQGVQRESLGAVAFVPLLGGTA